LDELMHANGSPGRELASPLREGFALDVGILAFAAINYTTLQRFGQWAVEDAQFRNVTRLHHKLFLPGLAKLGLDKERSDAVRSAKYHVLANQIGGLDVSYAEESDRKAWVFYGITEFPARKTTRATTFSPTTPANMFALGHMAFRPEWMHAQFRSWHAINGLSLGNPRLGFVMTHNTQSGHPYDGGYFLEGDHDLADSERFQVRLGEKPPDGVPIVRLPLEHWNAARETKARLNYPSVYFREFLTDLRDVFTEKATAQLVELSWRALLFQNIERYCSLLAIENEIASGGLVRFVWQLLSAFGDEVALAQGEDGHWTVSTSRFRLFGDVEPAVRQAFDRALSALQEYRFPGCRIERDSHGQDRWSYRIADSRRD
jgi:hypothetical protein